jgi:hypothetical protein
VPVSTDGHSAYTLYTQTIGNLFRHPHELMKKLSVLAAASLLLVPMAALAQVPPPRPDILPGARAELRAEVRAEMKAEQGSTTDKQRPPMPKLGPAIKNMASSTRAEWKEFASTTRQAVRMKVDAIHTLIDKHKDAMRERSMAAREKAKARFGERVETLVGNVSDRLASTSARLAATADRIGSHIDKLQDDGNPMQQSSELLVVAKTDLATANEKILAVNVALEAAMGTTTPKGQIPAVRTAVKAAEDALKLVKDDLQKTLQSIRVEAAATTTSTI